MDSNIIIYESDDHRVRVSLMAQDGNVWMNQAQISDLFGTSLPNISMHMSNILNEGELDKNSVIKYYLTTAPDGKQQLFGNSEQFRPTTTTWWSCGNRLNH